MNELLSYLFYPIVLTVVVCANLHAFNAKNGFVLAAILTLAELSAMFGSWILAILLNEVWPIFACNLAVACLCATVGIVKKNEPHWRKTGCFSTLVMLGWIILSSLLFIGVGI